MIYEPDHEISDILVTMESMLGYLTAPTQDNKRDIPPVMGVEMENAYHSLKMVRGYVHGLRENIMKTQEDDYFRNGGKTLKEDLSGVDEHAPRTFKPDYRGRGDERAFGARGEATNAVDSKNEDNSRVRVVQGYKGEFPKDTTRTFAAKTTPPWAMPLTNTPRIDNPTDPRWADLAHVDNATTQQMAYVVGMLHKMIKEFNEVKAQHGDDAYKKGTQDGMAEVRAEIESVARKLTAERTELLGTIARLEKEAADVQSGGKFVAQLIGTRMMEIERQMYDVRGKNTALEIANRDLRKANESFGGIGKLCQLLQHKRVIVHHNWNGEHNRSMDFAPHYVLWANAPNENDDQTFAYRLVGMNETSGGSHSFTAAQIDEWSPRV